MKSLVSRVTSSTLAGRPSNSRPRSISLRAPAPIILRAEASGTGAAPPGPGQKSSRSTARDGSRKWQVGALRDGNMDGLRRQAAARAVEYVRTGMRRGLGTGSTAKHFVELLGERVRAGLDVAGVPTSEATRADAVRCG